LLKFLIEIFCPTSLPDSEALTPEVVESNNTKRVIAKFQI